MSRVTLREGARETVQILVVGLNHKVAPLEVRERLAFTENQLPPALNALAEHVVEGVILSTCNRSEVYAVVSPPSSCADDIKRFLSECQDIPLDVFDPYLYVYYDQDAVRHLFRVASGVDSMVLGEPQILGQVKDAFEHAEANKSVGRVLSALFRQALAVGKRARTETDISKNAASVSYVAVELAKKIFGELRHCTVLIVGAGEMGKLTARTLLDNDAGALLVANRTYARARDLANRFGGRAVEFGNLREAIASSDIVISSTGGSDYIITADMVKYALQQRRNRPMFFIDIAVPRDIDPQVDKIENAFLYNVDDLQAVREANLREREKEAKKAEAIVEGETEKFMHWLSTLDVVPTIAALCDKLEDIRQAEVSRMLPKLGELSDRDREKVNALTVAIVNKILHLLITRLKAGHNGRDAREYAHVVRELFDIVDETKR